VRGGIFRHQALGASAHCTRSLSGDTSFNARLDIQPAPFPPALPGTVWERQKRGASGCEWGNGRPEPTVQDGGADLKNPMCATRRPAHLSAFVHAGVDQIVHQAFGA
jgi:hypothetical protein